MIANVCKVASFSPCPANYRPDLPIKCNEKHKLYFVMEADEGAPWCSLAQKAAPENFISAVTVLYENSFMSSCEETVKGYILFARLCSEATPAVELQAAMGRLYTRLILDI